MAIELRLDRREAGGEERPEQERKAEAHHQVAREDDLRRAWPVLLTVPVFCGLQAVALARYPAVVAWDRPGAWLYLAFLVSLAAVCLLERGRAAMDWATTWALATA